MKDIQKYLMHSSGFYSFINWLADLEKIGMTCEVKNDIVNVNFLFSKYLSFGISSSKRGGGEPFIAFPSQEAQWMHMLSWKNIIFRKNDNLIYFITEGCKSPSHMYPDIPSFGISFYTDLKDKLELLQQNKRLIVREYFKEDNGEVYINFHNTVCKIPVNVLLESEDIPLDSAVQSYDNFLSSNVQLMISYGERFNPLSP